MFYIGFRIFNIIWCGHHVLAAKWRFALPMIAALVIAVFSSRVILKW